jgi:hypothetical protein
MSIVAICIFFLNWGCTTLDASDTNCNVWFNRTLTAVESLPVEQRYQKIIEQIAKGCNIIPLPLRQAAGKSLEKKGADSKRPLMLAAAAYVSKECMLDDPEQAAGGLVHICFEDEWPDGDLSAMIKHVDAATYLYCRALKSEFLKAGTYDEQGKKLLSNLLISNAAIREPE